MKIQKPELIENNNGTIRVQSRIEISRGKQLLWYELDSKYKDYLTLDRLDAFVVGLTLYAMQTHQEIVVEGPISSKLARNLNYYMHVTKMFFPALNVVPLQAPERDPLLECPRGKAVGSSFTTGIDSYCTLWDNFKNAVDDTHKITHVFNMYAGQRGWEKMDGRTLFKKRLESISEAAHRINLELVVVDSNLEDFYGPDGFKYSLYQVPAVAGSKYISGALLLQNLFSIFYFPASFQYGEFKPFGTTPLSDPLLSTEVLEVIHDGAQYSRVEKTNKISEWDITHSILSVCNDYQEGKINCSRCDKCLRAMVTFDMLGVREQYENVFDFTDFEKKKDLYICHKFLSGLVGKKHYSAFWTELKKPAKELGYPLKIKPWKLLLAIWINLTNPFSVKKFLLRTTNWAKRKLQPSG